MTERAYIQDRKDETDRYASREDFRRIFNEDLDALYQLSFLLTRDPQKAEQCFIGGLEDCVARNSVFRDWARSSAKRAIVQNAIRELNPRPGLSNSPTSAAIFPDIDQPLSGPANYSEIDTVFRLEDYERFVFVMCVLEHYSQHVCALLLGCSVPEVWEAYTRALNGLAHSPHMNRSQNQMLVQEKK
jgi:DNA-directed RNA polymerase specialized sigma24 family protein